jgi:hypothetical protein
MTMTAPMHADPTVPFPKPPDKRITEEELRVHARHLGIDPEFIKVQDLNAPDCVTVTIGKPDGRTIRRVVPRDRWDVPEYRHSLIRNLGVILA